MSFLLLLDEKDLAKLLPMLDKYEAEAEAAAPIFKLEGERIETLCRSLPHWLSSYDQKYQELKGLEDRLVAARDKVQAKIWKRFLEGYSRVLATKDIQMYMAGEPEYAAVTELILEVQFLKNKFQSIVKALETMNWMLNNIVKLRIAEMQDAIL